MTAKTNADRQRAKWSKKKELGLKRLEVLAHPADHGAIRAKAASLTKARQRKEKKDGMATD